MQQAVRLEMDPDEWATFVNLAARAVPKKGDGDEAAMSKLLKEKGDIIRVARTVDIKQPF